MIPEFQVNDYNCGTTLLKLISEFPQVARGSSDYGFMLSGKTYMVPFYQTDVIYWISCVSDVLREARNVSSMDPHQVLEFNDSFYFINYNFIRSIFIDFEKDINNVPNYFEGLIKSHFTYTSINLGILIGIWFLMTFIMVIFYNNLFVKITKCKTIFTLIPNHNVDELRTGVQRFKEVFLKIIPLDHQMFINDEREPMVNEEDLESWEKDRIKSMELEKKRAEDNLNNAATRRTQRTGRNEIIISEALPDSEKKQKPTALQKDYLHEAEELENNKQPELFNMEDRPLIASRNKEKVEGNDEIFHVELKTENNRPEELVKPTNTTKKNKVAAKGKSRIVFTNGQPDAQAGNEEDSQSQEGIKQELLYKDSFSYYPGLFRRLTCTGFFIFPIPILIIIMDYYIYSEYSSQALFLNQCMKTRTNLHYLNALNYEITSNGRIPKGHTLQSTDKEVDMIEYFSVIESEFLARFAEYRNSDFPSYLKTTIDKFILYTQGNICKMGGLKSISYLASCRLISP